MIIGRKVCFTNANGLKRYGRIIAVSNDGELVEVAWEVWTEYLASLPLVTDADAEGGGYAIGLTALPTVL
jgi:hypothetical protein